MPSARTRGWPALLAALLLASGCGAASSKSSTGAADAPGSTSPGLSAATGAVSGGSAGGPASGSTPDPAAGSSSGKPAAPGAIARSIPVRLQIPDIGVDTPVMSLGLAADNTLEVPPIKAASPAGWYRGSPTPGQTGPSVILGHVTVGQYGDGVFLHLAQLHPGARVLVKLEDGATAAFVVDTVRTVAKDKFPAAEVYGNVNRPELRLITCGGPRTGDGYLDNVVVFASLAAAE